MWKNSRKHKKLVPEPDGFSCFELPYVAFIIIFLAVFLFIGCAKVLPYFRSSHWLVVEGRILSYDIEYDNEGYSRPAVEYQFYFEGQRYQGNNYSFGGDIYTNLRKLKTYESGQSVSIYFDTSNPKDNILNREIDSVAYFFIVPTLGGIIFFLYGYHMQRGGNLAKQQNINGTKKTR